MSRPRKVIVARKATKQEKVEIDNELKDEKFDDSFDSNNDDDDDDDDDDLATSDLDDTSLSSDNVYNPLIAEKVVEKEYTKLDADIKGVIPEDIPEPVFEKTKVDFTEPIIDPLAGVGEEPPKFDKEPEPKKPDRGDFKTPGWEDLTSKQKNASAEYLAETCINAYEMICNLGLRWTTYGEDKMQRDALDGSFDFSVLAIEINLSEDGSQSMSIGEFFDSINQQAKEVFAVSDEFKTNVKPLLIEIFKKKGWGLTTEQRLIALVVEDLTPKVALAFSIKSQIKQLLKMGMQMIQQRSVEQPEEPARPQAKQEVKKEPEVIVPEVIGENNEYKEPGN